PSVNFNDTDITYRLSFYIIKIISYDSYLFFTAIHHYIAPKTLKNIIYEHYNELDSDDIMQRTSATLVCTSGIWMGISAMLYLTYTILQYIVDYNVVMTDPFYIHIFTWGILPRVLILITLWNVKAIYKNILDIVRNIHQASQET